MQTGGESGGLGESCKDNAPEAGPIDSDILSLELKRAFSNMDAGKTGKLEVDDIGKVLGDLGYTLDEASCVIQTLDVDGDGSVSKDEFLRACESETVCVTRAPSGKDLNDKAIICEFYQRLVSYRRKQKGRV